MSAILCILVSDSLGRRRTLLLGITIWTIGEIIQTSSFSFAQFIVGRAIAGFGNVYSLRERLRVTTNTIAQAMASLPPQHLRIRPNASSHTVKEQFL